MWIVYYFFGATVIINSGVLGNVFFLCKTASQSLMVVASKK